MGKAPRSADSRPIGPQGREHFYREEAIGIRRPQAELISSHSSFLT
jgi:hypothetical protein